MTKYRIDWLNHGLEFSVVLVGILIAFQLNKCAADSQQQDKIEIHLSQIHKEAQFNRQSLQNAIKSADSNMKKLDTLIALSLGGTELNKINSLSIDLLNLGGVYFRKNAYQNLVETGDIRFIKEYRIKQRIIDLYEFYKWVESFDQISRNLYMQDFYPYIINNLDLVTNRVQDPSIYTSQRFKNILASYKYTGGNRVQKYRECLEQVEKYIEEQTTNL